MLSLNNDDPFSKTWTSVVVGPAGSTPSNNPAMEYVPAEGAVQRTSLSMPVGSGCRLSISVGRLHEEKFTVEPVLLASTTGKPVLVVQYPEPTDALLTVRGVKVEPEREP